VRRLVPLLAGASLWITALAVLLVLATLPAWSSGGRSTSAADPDAGAVLAAAPGGPAAPDHPNVVLFLTDDQRWDQLEQMPNVQRLLVDHGVRFENGFVVNSLCCPSRAGSLTGGYSHSTGVYTLTPPLGGYAAFDDRSTIATWLHDAGYHTALLGKYLNGYDGTRIPPGWDRWFAFQQNHGNYYYDYSANDDGVLRSFGSDPEDYSTSLITAGAVDFIRATAGPLFLYLAPYAPHAPAIPAPGDESAFWSLPPDRPVNYDESDVSDKPAWVRALPGMSGGLRSGTDVLRLNMFRSLLAVDRMVGQVVDAMAETGRLHDTMFVFTSDNGLALGEHRWVHRKESAYEESIRVPLVIRYDPLVRSPRVDGHLVTNIDFAPTAAQLAGVEATGADGRSLLPLLMSPAAPWRDDFLIEHEEITGIPDPPTFCGVRTTDHLYVQYATGEEELYDLRTDPYELDNAVDDPGSAPLLGALRLRLRELCRPQPPGFAFSH
jgi:arylsulfatase A-like enzyme